MSLVKYTEHPKLDEFEGHPVLTQLRAANQHLTDALEHTKVAVNDKFLTKEIWFIKGKIMLLEDAYGHRKFQH